jgi:hypothetical protein
VEAGEVELVGEAVGADDLEDGAEDCGGVGDAREAVEEVGAAVGAEDRAAVRTGGGRTHLHSWSERTATKNRTSSLLVRQCIPGCWAHLGSTRIVSASGGG